MSTMISLKLLNLNEIKIKKLADDEIKNDKLQYFIDTLIKFKPLMSCTANALEYLKGHYQNTVHDALTKLLEFTEKLNIIVKEIKFTEESAIYNEFINSTFVDLNEIVNIHMNMEPMLLLDLDMKNT
ncbi:uncharacterized protein LOC126904412 [Daktulosphaira vitifoliae]|uniref:uncharacterized protein LOC126904412 n=1 Tax=Daktulosphaira vitifoliae TaxID=58002 RepID=UPI0021A9A5E3|nr:uncharacterized protein LOC126904412 [Daktulosphaira vitifoliae]XP_050539404.1 uncharacterized protein LOC126904412 [Daktulosphaira vitifoliae]